MNFGKQASYWKPSLKTRFTCESQITNSVGHFQKKSLLSSIHLHSLLASSILEKLCHIIVGLRISQLLSHLGTVLPWYYPKLFVFHEMILVTSCFPFLQQPLRPFLSELSRQEQGPLSCSDKMAQWSAVGLGNLDLAAALRPLYLTTCTSLLESWVVEFELISIRDFVTCHLCPFVELLQEQ